MKRVKKEQWKPCPWQLLNDAIAFSLFLLDSYTPKNTRGQPHTTVFSTTSFWPDAYTIILLSSSTFWNTYICTPALFSLGHGTSLKHIIVHMHTSACICTLMDTFVYRCMHMYVHYPILDWLCMHMHTYASTWVHMHADVCIWTMIWINDVPWPKDTSAGVHI